MENSKNFEVTKIDKKVIYLFVVLKFVYVPLQILTFCCKSGTFIVFTDAALQEQNGVYRAGIFICVWGPRIDSKE